MDMTPPMTMDERVEAAVAFLRQSAEAIEAGYLMQNRADMETSQKANMRRFLRYVFAAAFPELHGDQPKGWIAPWEPTKEMWAAGRVVDGYMLHSVGSVWDAMRDAYLGKGDGEQHV